MVTLERVINGSEELFLNAGIKSVTMDDVARHLGISKKTIYHFFRDKNEFVDAIVSKRLREDCDDLLALVDGSENMINKLVSMTKGAEEIFSRINPIVVHDLRKYFPVAWLRFQKFKAEFLVSTLENLLKKGIQQGYIRPDIDIKIIARMRVNLIELGFDSAVFPTAEFNIWKVQHQFLEHFNYGICTVKGINLLNQHKDAC